MESRSVRVRPPSPPCFAAADFLRVVLDFDFFRLFFFVVVAMREQYPAGPPPAT
jgi:hypothetical protein